MSFTSLFFIWIYVGLFCFENSIMSMKEMIVVMVVLNHFPKPQNVFELKSESMLCFCLELRLSIGK